MKYHHLYLSAMLTTAMIPNFAIAQTTSHPLENSSTIPTVTTEGIAEEQIKPDLASWGGAIKISEDVSIIPSFKNDKFYSDETKKKISSARDKLIKYLESNKIPQNSIQFAPAEISIEHNSITGQVSRYTAVQSFDVRMTDVDLLTKVAHEAVDLFSSDTLFQFLPVSYYIKDVDEVQLKLLEKALKQAHQKAMVFAASENKKIQLLKAEELQNYNALQDAGRVYSSKISPTDTSGITKSLAVHVRVTYSLK